MKIDILFDFAKVYDIKRVDVVIGQEFALLTDYKKPSRWFADNDPVLDVVQDGNNADIKALKVGVSTIIIFDETYQDRIDSISINVIEPIDQAASLNPSADETTTK